MQLLTEYDEGTDTRYDCLYGPDSMPLQLLVTASDGTTSTYAYQVDHAGSVIGMTDEDGDEVARYAYDPYGALIHMSGDAIAECGRHHVVQRVRVLRRGMTRSVGFKTALSNGLRKCIFGDTLHT